MTSAPKTSAPKPDSTDHDRPATKPHLRLVHSTTTEPRADKAAKRTSKRASDEAGTTTAEYTVVTAAAVAFGALLLKLLTGSWGERILETAFREVIKMLGF